MTRMHASRRISSATRSTEPWSLDLASRLRLRLDERRAPAEVIARVPAALDRLHAFLERAGESYDLGDEWFLKDVRFAAGWTVPCGAEVVDLRSRRQLPVILVAASGPARTGLAVRAVGPEARKPWFEHAHRVAISR